MMRITWHEELQHYSELKAGIRAIHERDNGEELDELELLEYRAQAFTASDKDPNGVLHKAEWVANNEKFYADSCEDCPRDSDGEAWLFDRLSGLYQYC